MTRFAAIAALLVGVGPLLSRAAEDATDKVFVGYLYGPPRDLKFPLYTHLCHAFLTPEDAGNVKRDRNVPSRDLTSNAHKNGVKVLVSLGGWGWDKQFAALVSKSESEDRFVKDVMEIVDEFDYDGIDLDWEYPDTKGEIAGFERLCRRFRKQLDELGKKKGRHLLQTMAASANPGTLRWLDRDFLAETMDWINVMTYDYTGDWSTYAGHQSPLFASSKQPGNRAMSSEATIKYLLDERKIPTNLLAMGIPLYGRGFAVAEPYASTKDVAKTRMPQGDYKNLHRLLHEQGWTRTWDDETKNPWLTSPDHKMVIGYDDAESVAIKADWARKQGLRGVFFWQVAGDRMPDGTNPLQEAVAQELGQHSKNGEVAVRIRISRKSHGSFIETRHPPDIHSFA